MTIALACPHCGSTRFTEIAKRTTAAPLIADIVPDPNDPTALTVAEAYSEWEDIGDDVEILHVECCGCCAIWPSLSAVLEAVVARRHADTAAELLAAARVVAEAPAATGEQLRRLTRAVAAMSRVDRDLLAGMVSR